MCPGQRARCPRAPVLALHVSSRHGRCAAASPARVSASGTPASPRWRSANERCRPSSPRREDGTNQPRLHTAPSNFGNCSQLAGTQRTRRLLGDRARLRAAGGPALHQPPRLRGARRRRRPLRARGARSEPLACVSRSKGIAAPQGTRPDTRRGAAARTAARPLPGSVTSRARQPARAARGGRGAAGTAVRTGRRAAENDSAGEERPGGAGASAHEPGPGGTSQGAGLPGRGGATREGRGYQAGKGLPGWGRLSGRAGAIAEEGAIRR